MSTPSPNVKLMQKNLSKQRKSAEQDSQHKLIKLESLLLLEGELRSAETLQDLIYCIANETRKCIVSRQTFVLKATKNSKSKFVIDAVSNISVIDRNAPAIRFLENSFNEEIQKWQEKPKEKKITIQDGVSETEDSSKDPFTFTLPQCDDESQIPFKNALAIPLFDRNGTNATVYAVVILLNEKSFDSPDQVIAKRLEKSFCHAWLALQPRPSRKMTRLLSKGMMSGAAILCLLAMFIPVPLTTLAPSEVVASAPHIVAAPIDGVIAEIEVEPNSIVDAGTILFRYRDTELNTALSIAQKGRDVARARYQTARQSSFSSATGRREVAVAEAELSLAEAELLHAQERLAQTIVRAPLSGLVVFDRQTDWQGRPVSVGERVVEIADPTRIEYRIDLPVSDSIVLADNSRIKVFLDAEPLSSKQASLSQAGYRATKSSDDQLVYRLYAEPKGDDIPRIGSRGTAQIFADDVSLGFYLFRRPLSVARQYLGW